MFNILGICQTVHGEVHFRLAIDIYCFLTFQGKF